MKISLLIPDVNLRPTARPRSCPYCGKAILNRHGTVLKPIEDHKAKEVEAHLATSASLAPPGPSGTTPKG